MGRIVYMKRKYAYVFPMGNGLTWSGETADSLRQRTKDPIDLQEIEGLIEADRAGNFVTLSTGEMIFQIT